MRITYTVDCHCGGEAELNVMHLDLGSPDAPIRIDVDMTIGAAEFTRPDCDCCIYTGDIETMNDNEDSRTGSNDEDDEDEELQS
jgi:hypothetical protein